MIVRKERIEVSTDQVLSHIIPCMTSKENFNELPEDTPHVNYNEMVIIFRVVFGSGEGPFTKEQRGWGIVSKQNMEDLELNLGRLLALSMENAKDSFHVEGLSQLLLKLFDDPMEEEVDPVMMARALEPGEEEIYVLTNKNGMFGAAGMLFEEALKMAASKAGGDFYLIPSSIHECLIIPAREGEDWKTLKSILTQINYEIVAEEDILSYSIYKYNGRLGSLIKMDE